MFPYVLCISEPLMDPDEIWAAVNRKEHVSLEYSKQMESLGIDLIITPGGFLPAPDKVSTYVCNMLC